MLGQFRTVRLVEDGNKIEVTGTFDPGDPDVATAKVLFLLVQGDGGRKTVIVEGEAKWKRSFGDEWKIKVPNKGVFPRPKSGAASNNSKARLEWKRSARQRMVRGIALAIAIKPAKPADIPRKFNPPQIEALTWCVELALQKEPPAPESQMNGAKRARRAVAPGKQRTLIAK